MRRGQVDVLSKDWASRPPGRQRRSGSGSRPVSPGGHQQQLRRVGRLAADWPAEAIRAGPSVRLA